MKITLEATGEFEGVNGTRTRIWKGSDENGLEVIAYIAMVRVDANQDQAAFLRELSEVKVSRDLVYFDNRMLGDG